MRAVVQRVKGAEVSVDGKIIGAIQKGLLAYIGIEKGDSKDDLLFISSKLRCLRIFEDDKGKMNLDVAETKGALLIVSQFTLLGDCSKGKRPSFDEAAPLAEARALYEDLVRELRGAGLLVETGEFQAHMEVESINDGPVTFVLESRRNG